MADTALQDAITKASEQLTAEVAGTKPAEAKSETQETAEVEVETEAEVETEEETQETSETQEEELSEAQRTEAQRLYRALNNKDTAVQVVAALAAQMGLLGKGQVPETKTEVKEAKKELKDIVSEKLGEEYKFLGDKIAGIFEEVLAQERANQQQQFLALQAKEFEREVSSVFSALATETKGESKKLEARMAELSGEIEIGKMNVDTYVRRLYSIASGERRVSSPQKIADKIRKNANDVPSRLRTTAGPGPSSQNSVPDKKMSLNESVSFALDQLTKQSGLRK